MDRQPVLEGDLVRLRPLVDDDRDALWRISSDPRLWEQHPAKERAEPDGFRRWFADALASGGALVVEDRADGSVIGTSRYDRLDLEAGEVEIGWTFLARSRWGGPWNGEVKRLMLDHAFRFVGTVVFRAHADNRRSRRAIEKLGAQLVGTEPDPLGRGENACYRLHAPVLRLHPDEAPTDVDLVRRLLRAQHPRWADRPIARVPSTGTVHWLYRVGDDLVARLPRIEHGVGEIVKERAWLPRIAAAVPVAVPELVADGEAGEGYPWPWAVYRWLDGEHPDPSRLLDPNGLAEDLAAFVLALRQLPTAGAPRGFRSEHLHQRDERTRRSLREAADLVEAEALLAQWDALREVAVRSDVLPWQHGDLLPGNLLIGPAGRLTGVIDWGCAGTADPAVELLVAWAVLTAEARRRFRAALAIDDATWARGRAWALSVAALQVPYYRATNPGLAAVGVHMLEQLAADPS